jgi:hypothetical protein
MVHYKYISKHKESLEHKNTNLRSKKEKKSQIKQNKRRKKHTKEQTKT